MKGLEKKHINGQMMWIGRADVCLVLNFIPIGFNLYAAGRPWFVCLTGYCVIPASSTLTLPTGSKNIISKVGNTCHDRI